MILAIVLFLLATAVPAAMAQQPAPTIRGRVVSAEDGTPLPRARIAMMVDGRGTQPVFTDNQGRFTFDRLGQGTVSLVAGKAGYASLSLPVAQSQTFVESTPELLIQLERGAAISGRIVEPTGAPAVAVFVMARRIDVDAEKNPSSVAFTTATDDLGEYRLGGLPAGVYEVASATSPRNGAEGTTLTLSLTTDSVDRFREQLVRPDGAVPATVSRPPSLQGPGRKVELRAGVELADVDFVIDAVSTPSSALLAPRIRGASGVIRGRVLTLTGEPIAGSVLQLFGKRVARAVTSDARGRYALEGLPSGDYTIEARKTGYVTWQYGQSHSAQPGETVTLRQGETVDRVDIVLPRGSVVSGAIIDEHGEPLQGVSVRALQLRTVSGRTVAISTGWERLTDDRGQYRLFGLVPGSYVVAASADAASSPPDHESARTFVPVFFPGTSRIDDATRVDLEIGRDASGIDLVSVPSRGARVTGVALDANGNPLIGSVLLGVSHRSGATAIEPRRVAIGSDGAFSLSNVPPGDYVVQALGVRAPGRAAEFGAEYVSVGVDDPPPLTIRTSAGTTLEGRIIFEGDQPGLDRVRVSLKAIPVDLDRFPLTGQGVNVSTSSNGTFYTTGLYGQTKLALGRTLGDWYLKSVTIDGFDATVSGFEFGMDAQTLRDVEIEIAPARARVSGSVADERSAPAGDAWVVVFSADREQWFTDSGRLKSRRTSADGSFLINGLPPGDYWIAAVDQLEKVAGSDDWRSPAALESLSLSARRLSLGGSDHETTSLRLIRR